MYISPYSYIKLQNTRYHTTATIIYCYKTMPGNIPCADTTSARTYCSKTMSENIPGTKRDDTSNKSDINKASMTTPSSLTSTLNKESGPMERLKDLESTRETEMDDKSTDGDRFENSIWITILGRFDDMIQDLGIDYDENAPVCRICHGSTENLKSLCECKGTMGLVHAECLTHWLSESGRSCCEICNFQYKFKRTLKRPFLQTLSGWLFKVVEDNQVFIILSWLMAITPIILLASALCVYCLRQIFIYSDRVRSVHPAVAFFTFTCSLTLVVWYYDMLFMIVRAYFDNWRFYYIRDHDIEIIFPDRPSSMTK